MYDWANSAFQTTIVAAVFPIYFHKVAAFGLAPAEATSRFAWATTIAILIVIFAFSFAMSAPQGSDTTDPRWNDPLVRQQADEATNAQRDRLGGEPGHRGEVAALHELRRHHPAPADGGDAG